MAAPKRRPRPSESFFIEGPVPARLVPISYLVRQAVFSMFLGSISDRRRVLLGRERSIGSFVGGTFVAMRWKLAVVAVLAWLSIGAGCQRVSKLTDKASDVAKPTTTNTPITSGTAMGSAKPRGPVKEATTHPRLFIREQDVQR